MGKSQSKLPLESVSELQQCTAFTAKELKKWHKGFMAECPSGRMTKNEFEKIYNNSFQEGDASRFADHVFRTFDKDGDESIDFKEFICGLSITCHGSEEDKLRWAFHMYDVDRSGSITEDELVEIIRSICKMMGDEDVEKPKRIADRLFLRMDGDGDGEVTLEEFVDAAKNDTTVLSLLQQ